MAKCKSICESCCNICLYCIIAVCVCILLCFFLLFFVKFKLCKTSAPERKGIQCNSSVGSANVHIQDDKSVRILCWIMVFSNNESNTDSVESTWGKRCDVLLFINSTIVPCLDGENNQWRRSKKAFKYIYENHIMDADWFLKAENDTYVIIENLRYFLQNKSLTEPTYYGRRFKPYVSQDYMNGKAGFVINKMTLELLYRKGLDNSSICSSDEKEKYDIAVGKCLEHLGVIPGNSRDEKGRERFLSFTLEQHLIPGLLPKVDYYPFFYCQNPGFQCCSDYVISFHTVSASWMHMFDYIIYQLKVNQFESDNNLISNDG